MSNIVIIDYGVGNFRNVQKAFEFIGATAEITDNLDTINQASALVLPGVGAFGDAIDNVRARNLEKPIVDAVKQGKPLIGICVGLQLLFDESDEMGHHKGLGILPGNVTRFPHTLTVPHMGWNQIEPVQNHFLLNHIEPGEFVYFANSYHAVPANSADVIAQTEYGAHVPTIVGREAVCAIQFHPEKSQKAGLQILKNFVEFVEQA